MGREPSGARLRGQIEKLEALRVAIEQLAPRDEKGETMRPYLNWMNRLGVDIAKARGWLVSMGKTMKGGE